MIPMIRITITSSIIVKPRRATDECALVPAREGARWRVWPGWLRSDCINGPHERLSRAGRGQRLAGAAGVVLKDRSPLAPFSVITLRAGAHLSQQVVATVRAVPFVLAAVEKPVSDS